MKFLEALEYCKQTGGSITRARYSAESQNSVQWYLDHDNILVCQNYDGAPQCKSITKEYWKDEWIEYTGSYQQYTTKYKEILARMKTLEEELSPILSKLDEYQGLKTSLAVYEANR